MKSLQDQLLQAGLTDKQSVKNARKQKAPKKPKKARRLASHSAMQAEQALADKAQRDRQLNHERQAKAQEKAILAQVKQLIEVSKIDRADGEHPYNFTFHGKIKTLYIRPEQQKQLALNQVTIVALDDTRFELVPKLVAEKIAQRDKRRVVPNKSGVEDSGEDDPYADYQVPDDLIW